MSPEHRTWTEWEPVLSGLKTGGPDLVVELEDHGRSLTMAFAGGTLSFEGDSVRRPDLYLRVAADVDPLSLLARSAAPWSAAVQLRARGPLDQEWLPLPPFELPLPDDGVGTLIEGASVTVQHVARASLVGDIQYHDRFANGLLVQRSGGMAAHSDMIVINPYAARLSSLGPTGSVQQSAQTARFGSGHVTTALLVAGLYDDVHFRRWAMPRQSTVKPLIALSEHLSSRVWRKACGDNG